MNRKLETPGYAYIEVEIRHVTTGAVLVRYDKTQKWIPRTQIEEPDPATLEIGKTATLLVAEWVVIDRGLDAAVVDG